jgi:hypothetical protein
MPCNDIAGHDCGFGQLSASVGLCTHRPWWIDTFHHDPVQNDTP